MPRAPSNKTRQPRSSMASTAASSASRPASASASNEELKRIDKFFNKYANKSMGMIEFYFFFGSWGSGPEGQELRMGRRLPEGIEKLCSDIKIDQTDVRALMLAWKMQSERPGYFTPEEWRRCMSPLCVHTVAKLKKALPVLEKEVNQPSNFESFYSYAFKYCLTEERQKTVDIGSIRVLLGLLLGSRFPDQVHSLVNYLEAQTDYKAINMDQWMGFYRFCSEISFPDMSNYDVNDSWPLILDNFVDWKKRNQN